MTGLNAGIIYGFKVAAINSFGMSAQSSVLQITTTTTTTVPDPPTALTRDDSNTNLTQIAFLWTAPVNNGG
jgi:hypothetical protein